jgi:hypothetical protein
MIELEELGVDGASKGNAKGKAKGKLKGKASKQ